MHTYSKIILGESLKGKFRKNSIKRETIENNSQLYPNNRTLQNSYFLDTFCYREEKLKRIICESKNLRS